MSVTAGTRSGGELARTAGRSVAGVRPRHVGFIVSCAVLGLLLVCAVAPGLLAPHDPFLQRLADARLAPLERGADGTLYLFGTDTLGRDVLSRVIYGAQISLAVGVGGVLVASLIGVPLGIIAGYRGGPLDTVIMRFVHGMLSFPALVLAIFFMYVVGGGVLNTIIVLALIRWVAYARVGRSLTLSLREAAFVDSARSVGCSDLRIVFRHILPNVLSPLIVICTLEVAMLILAESSLSFLGLGVQPPQPSWGVMVAEGRDYLTTSWWLVVIPGLAIFLATVNLNLVAMRLRGTSGRSRRSKLAWSRRHEQGEVR